MKIQLAIAASDNIFALPKVTRALHAIPREKSRAKEKESLNSGQAMVIC